MLEIIAECGVNHNGDIELAKEMVFAAKEAGADTVKFQLFSVDDLVRSNAPLANYQRSNFNSAIDQRELLNRLTLSSDQHLELVEICKNLEIKYLTSIFDMKSLEAATHTLYQTRVKLGSGELTNYQLIKGIIDHGLSVILSTGMSSLSEVKHVLKFISHIIEKPTEAVTRTKLENYKFNEELIKERISLLHCTSQYPTPISKINLNNIKTLKKIYIGSIGLSDHSEGYLAAVAGVGMGIEILEKHFTLSQKMQGPDHKASMEPAEFSQLVTLVRDAYKALGKHSKNCLI